MIGGCELGYWKIYEDLSLKFVPLKNFPKFIDVEREEDINDDGNYYMTKKKLQLILKKKIN